MRHRQEFERVGKRLGRVRPGMGKSEVRSKAGRPDDVRMGMASGETVECWRYMKLPPTDPAERFARVFRVCFRAGKVTEMRALLLGRTAHEVRFLVGPPDSTFRRKIRGRPARCWRWDYRIAMQTLCFRHGRVVYEKSFA